MSKGKLNDRWTDEGLDDIGESRFVRRMSWAMALVLFLTFGLFAANDWSSQRIRRFEDAAFPLSRFSVTLKSLLAKDEATILEAINQGQLSLKSYESDLRDADSGLSQRIFALWTTVRREAISNQLPDKELAELADLSSAGATKLLDEANRLRGLQGFASGGSYVLLFLLAGLGYWIFRRSQGRILVSRLIVDREHRSDLGFSPKAISSSSGIDLEHLPIPCCSFRSDGQIESWNKAMEELIGISELEAKHKKFWDVIGWMPTGEIGTAVLSQIFKGNRVDDIDWVFTHPTGERLDLRATLIPLLHTSGNMLGAVASITDRTLQLRQAKLLQDLDVIKNSLMSAVPETLIRLDSYGRAVEIRDNSKFLGGKVKDILGTTRWQKLMPEVIVQRILSDARETRLHQKTKDFVFDGEDGSHRLVFRLSPCGQTDVLLLIQETAMQGMVAEEGALNLMVEQMSDLFLMVDGRGSVVYANPSLCRLIQWKAEDLHSRSIVELLAPASRLNLLKGLGDLVQNPSSLVHFEMSLQLNSGKIVPVAVEATSRLGDPQVGAIVLHLTPIEETGLRRQAS